MDVAIQSQLFRKIIIFLSVENKMLNIKNKRVRDKYEKFAKTLCASFDCCILFIEEIILIILIFFYR